MRLKSFRISVKLSVLSVLSVLSFLSVPSVSAETHSVSSKNVVRLNRAPVSMETLRVRLPRPREFSLPNGLKVLLVEDHDLPTVDFSLWIGNGAMEEPEGFPGLAEFTASMLSEGTAKRSSLEIARETESLGASLGASAPYGMSRTFVSASGLSRDAEKILDLLSDITLCPAFPENELSKYKKRRLSELREALSQPGHLAFKGLKKLSYGKSPASIVDPTPASISSVTARDLKAFHESRYLPGSSILGIAGDISRALALALAKKYFGSWKPGAAPAAAPVALAPKRFFSIHLIDRPHSVQATVAAGEPAIRRSDPDYIPLEVANQVLGGGTSSRLFLELREEKGYTYGVYSLFRAHRDYPGLFAVWMPARNSVAYPALKGMLDQLKGMTSGLVSRAELTETKRLLVSRFALSLERASNVLSDWLEVSYFNLPRDYYDAYPQNVARVDPDQVLRVSRKHMDPSKLQVVVVGDRAVIGHALQKIGPVAALSLD